MFGPHKVSAIIFIIVLTGILSAQCDTTITRVTTFTNSMLELEFEKYNREQYSTMKDKLGEFVSQIEISDCDTQIKDSLMVNLYMIFSEYVSRKNGDLMEYRSAWKKINIFCDNYLSGSDSTNIALIDYYSAIKNEFESNQYWLKNNYADLVIVMDNFGIRKNKMGVVKNELNNDPISIHIQPPLSIRNNYEKRKRLEYISAVFELDFSTIDPKLGFIKKITDLPVPDPGNENILSEEIFESFAMTFDDSIRYRIELNRMGQFDTLFIKPEKNWVLIKEIPADIVVIKMPKGLDYQVYDSKTLSPKDYIVKNQLIKDELYIRNNIDENVEIVFQKRIRVWTHVALRGIATAIFYITPLIIF